MLIELFFYSHMQVSSLGLRREWDQECSSG
jgi:hypothetical protein